MKKHILLMAIPVLLVCLIFVGCKAADNPAADGPDAADVSGQGDGENGEAVFSDPDVEEAYKTAKSYYKSLSMEVADINQNEAMDAADDYVSDSLEKYGDGNVVMFDTVTDDEPEVVRHIIIVREDADSDWKIEGEVLG